jgi:hypothetical protein
MMIGNARSCGITRLAVVVGLNTGPMLILGALENIKI